MNKRKVSVGVRGTKRWYLEGKLHREDGPAVSLNGRSYWYINGDNITEEQHKVITGG